MIWLRISKLFLISIISISILPIGVITAQTENSHNIAVLLPLTDKGKPYLERRSYQVLEGVKYAVHLHNKKSENKIGLLIRDTQSDSSMIVLIKEEMKNVKNLIGVIGSTTTKDSRDIIAVFSDMNIPIISPTATDETIPSLSPMVIQANPTFSTRGKIMASFAKNFHGLSNMAVIYTKEGYSALLAQSFQEEFEKLGGKITFSAAYNKDTKFETLIEEFEEASNEIEGLYIPVGDVKQCNLLNERLRDLTFGKNVYGNQDWLLSDVFGDPAPFLSTIYVDSDFYLDMTQPVYQAQNKEFYALTGYLFDRNALYGFDATAMFLKYMGKNNFDIQAFVGEVNNGIDFDGVKGKIVIDSARSNHSLNILQYTFGKFNLFLNLKL
ncbi:MAG: ABC transporter substrate-binding protein [Ignavibacteriales bacterium]|nr:ABC transporter substrate-binding protein [Ignavibacteriales bacterium]